VSARLLRRPVCAAVQPACAQVNRRIGLSGSGRKFPWLTGRSGMQRARPLRPELAAPLGVCPLPQLMEGVGGSSCSLLSGDVAVLSCCTGVSLVGAARCAVPTRRSSVFQAGHIPSWRRSYERYALSPVAGVSRWLLLLLSPLLSTSRKLSLVIGPVACRGWPASGPGRLPPVSVAMRKSPCVARSRSPLVAS
jgi:hypothetical protein